jgi:hypothetical protein
VRRRLEREALAAQAAARLEQRHVEQAPLKVTTLRKRASLSGHAAQHRGLLVVVAHEELLHAEAVAVDPAEADQERGRPGPTGQPVVSVSRNTAWSSAKSDRPGSRSGSPRSPARRTGSGSGSRRRGRSRGAPSVSTRKKLAALVLDPRSVDQLLDARAGPRGRGPRGTARNAARRSRPAAVPSAAARSNGDEPFQPLLERRAIAAVDVEGALEAIELGGRRIGARPRADGPASRAAPPSERVLVPVLRDVEPSRQAPERGGVPEQPVRMVEMDEPDAARQLRPGAQAGDRLARRAGAGSRRGCGRGSRRPPRTSRR